MGQSYVNLMPPLVTPCLSFLSRSSLRSFILPLHILPFLCSFFLTIANPRLETSGLRLGREEKENLLETDRGVDKVNFDWNPSSTLISNIFSFPYFFTSRFVNHFEIFFSTRLIRGTKQKYITKKFSLSLSLFLSDFNCRGKINETRKKWLRQLYPLFFYYYFFFNYSRLHRIDTASTWIDVIDWNPRILVRNSPCYETINNGEKKWEHCRTSASRIIPSLIILRALARTR